MKKKIRNRFLGRVYHFSLLICYLYSLVAPSPEKSNPPSMYVIIALKIALSLVPLLEAVFYVSCILRKVNLKHDVLFMLRNLLLA